MTDNEIVMFNSEVKKSVGQYGTSATEGKRQVHKLRSFASQCTATFAVNIIKFSFGTFTGFNTILLPELYKEDAEIPMTLDQLTWFGSFCFMLPVSAIITGLIPQPIGCRMTLLLAATIYTTSGIIFYFSTSATLLLVGQSLVGLFYATSFVPGATYIVEITQPQFRSALVASGNLFALIGMFFSVLVGSLIYWRTLALVNLIFPVVGFVAIYFVPNTPYWLAGKGRFREAERSLAWLRGWVSPEQVKDEFTILQGNLRNKSTDTVSNTENAKCSGIKNLKNKLQNYSDRGFWMPLATICYLFTIQTLAGTGMITAYSIILFDMMNSPIEKHTAAVILGGLRVIGAVICMCIIRKTGIRKLLFSSIAITGSSILIASLFLFLIKQKICSEPFAWVPTVMILVSAVSSSGGIDKITYILNVELFPARVRTVGAGFGYFVNCLLTAVGIKIFLYCIDLMTLEGVFLICGLVHVVGIITFYFIVPETRGKSLKEIEEYYSRNEKK